MRASFHELKDFLALTLLKPLHKIPCHLMARGALSCEANAEMILALPDLGRTSGGMPSSANPLFLIFQCLYLRCNMSFPSLQERFCHLSNHQQDIVKGLSTGVCVGTIVPTIINPLEKINTRLQVKTESQSLFKAIQIAPFKGIGVAIPNSVLKNLLLFGMMPCYRQATDSIFSSKEHSKTAAYVLSAMTLSYALSPFQVMKARLYTEERKTFKQIYREIPKGRKIKTLLYGSSATAIRYGFYYPFFLSLADQISKHLKNYPDLSESAFRPTLRAAVWQVYRRLS